MRLMKTMLLAAVLVTSASAAHAGDMTFGLNGGVAVPMGDFGDAFKLGFGGGVYADYWIKPTYAFGADINGSFFSAKDDQLDALKTAFPAYPDPSAKANLINFGVHGLWAPSMEGASMKPYITYGVGMYHIASKIEDSDPSVNFDDSENKIGINGGAGVDFAASEMMTVGVGAKFHHVLTEDEATQFITVGLNVTFKTAAQ